MSGLGGGNKPSQDAHQGTKRSLESINGSYRDLMGAESDWAPKNQTGWQHTFRADIDVMVRRSRSSGNEEDLLSPETRRGTEIRGVRISSRS